MVICLSYHPIIGVEGLDYFKPHHLISATLGSTGWRSDEQQQQNHPFVIEGTPNVFFLVKLMGCGEHWQIKCYPSLFA